MSAKILQKTTSSTGPAPSMSKKTCLMLNQSRTSGLAWIVWIINEAQSEAGGIYLFDDEQCKPSWTGQLLRR
ncbi:hypothetical protein EN925_23760 [Mesorhizobium sp. M7A.F.Ca.US.006.04.2.1]|nr:hypothetical protein EN990_11715 [Mesorhizobium sp. M7A.F.Ca.US.005.03.1.1]RUY17755.1 hypothetical protein EN991_06660 [Mesorhizobium sp. M7A.F.Ca.US.005.03.2.1]RUY27164.1 hypothetical protein EN979_17520 [Mesorhizobium sp. M7A.F.Ca.US.001.04.2.1]RUY41729.1 hypothetical protein EN978_14515 [Mesorhizobium sp. M7A.F.Ca.US.001.04.1.1]RVA86741.1 hypothetical protein EN925_23760 [Mesorhizobium sp. M7A.F.Ca.US.006.04.2.1]